MVRETKKKKRSGKKKVQTSDKRSSGLDEIAVNEKEKYIPKKRVFDAHAAHLASQNIADKLLAACLDSEIDRNTQDELLELVLGH